MEKYEIEELSVYSLSELPSVAADLLVRYGEEHVWLFDAPMGAGKTTLIKELCHQLGAEELAVSPTFAIVNVYPTSEGAEIFHLDCYRLGTEEDAYRIGVEEYLESGQQCFVEWPAVLGEILPEDTLWLRIDVLEGDRRRISRLSGAVEPLNALEDE